MRPTAMSVEMLQHVLQQCGVELPPAAQTARATLAALQAEASRDVVAEAIEAAATTPLTPKTAGKRVQELATALIARDRAVEASQHYERAVLVQFQDAVVASTDDLILAMRPYFDDAARVVQQAGELIDPDRPPTTDDSLQVLEVAKALDDAESRLSIVRSARIQVLELAGYPDPDVSWFIESAADSDALHLARVYFKRGWHRLTRAGYTLRLNLPSEAAAVVSGAANGTAAIATAKERDRIAAARDPLRDAAYSKLGL